MQEFQDQGILSKPATKPGLPPKTAPVGGGIAGIAGDSPTTAVGNPLVAGVDPFAFRGSSFAPRGPSNGPDSHALDYVNPILQGVGPISKAAGAAYQQAATVPGAISTQVAEPISADSGKSQRQAAGNGNPLLADFGRIPAANIAEMTPEQRMKAATAYGNAVDKATGISSAGAQGILGMQRRFDTYAKNPDALTMRNAREDLIGSGIRLEKGPDGITITDNGNRNPLAAAGGSTINMQEGNAAMARANAARESMIDSMIKANGGNGVTVLPDPRTQQAIQGMSISDIQSAMKSAGTRTERAAYGQMLQTAQAGQNQLAQEAIRHQGIMAGLDVQMRGQDMAARSEAARLAANPVRNQLDAEKLQSAQRLNGLQAQLLNESDPARRQEISDQIRALNGRTDERQGDRLTLPQRRSNFEIDAARQRIAGMDPAEIKRRTANFTATSRDNPDYDPTLAKAVSLANRRKYGADDFFDQRQQAEQPAGTDGDVMTRFRADLGMQGHKTGQMTEEGLEVFDASGKLIGHYR